MVKSVLDKSQFCVSKYPGCEKTTVNLLLPEIGEGGKVAVMKLLLLALQVRR